MRMLVAGGETQRTRSCQDPVSSLPHEVPKEVTAQGANGHLVSVGTAAHSFLQSARLELSLFHPSQRPRPYAPEATHTSSRRRKRKRELVGVAAPAQNRPHRLREERERHWAVLDAGEGGETTPMDP